MRLKQVGKLSGQRIHDAVHRLQPFQDMRLQLFPLAGAGGGKILHRVGQKVLHGQRKRFLIFGLADQHAGEAQDVGYRQLAQSVKPPAPFFV